MTTPRRRRARGSANIAPSLATATATRLGRLADQGAADGAAWRRQAWRLLAEARMARAAGDGDGCRHRLEEIRRLRRKAAKAAGFGRMCARRAVRLAPGDAEDA
jgi:hypothetical protein